MDDLLGTSRYFQSNSVDGSKTPSDGTHVFIVSVYHPDTQMESPVYAVYRTRDKAVNKAVFEYLSMVDEEDGLEETARCSLREHGHFPNPSEAFGERPFVYIDCASVQ